MKANFVIPKWMTVDLQKSGKAVNTKASTDALRLVVCGSGILVNTELLL